MPKLYHRYFNYKKVASYGFIWLTMVKLYNKKNWTGWILYFPKTK